MSRLNDSGQSGDISDWGFECDPTPQEKNLVAWGVAEPDLRIVRAGLDDGTTRIALALVASGVDRATAIETAYRRWWGWAMLPGWAAELLATGEQS